VGSLTGLGSGTGHDGGGGRRKERRKRLAESAMSVARFTAPVHAASILFFPLGPRPRFAPQHWRESVRQEAGWLAGGWMDDSSRGRGGGKAAQHPPTAGKRMESSRGILGPRWSSKSPPRCQRTTLGRWICLKMRVFLW
jgi:hypothetical protein